MFGLECNQFFVRVADEARAYEEARYNLATRVMSNGVEVIVAGDKSTLPGEPDVLRVLPSSIYKPVTLKPSTLSDHMMLMVPEGTPQVNTNAGSPPRRLTLFVCDRFKVFRLSIPTNSSPKHA